MTSSMTSKASYFKSWFLILVVVVLEWWTFFCFLGFTGQQSHSNYCQFRDLHAWPWNWRSRYGLSDFFISACIYPTAMICMLFREVFRSRNSFQLSPFAWTITRGPWNCRSRYGLRDFCHFCLYLSYRDDCFFCFVRFLVQGIHSNYCQLRDLHIQVPRNNKYHVDHDVTLSFKVIRKCYASGNCAGREWGWFIVPMQLSGT